MSLTPYFSPQFRSLHVLDRNSESEVLENIDVRRVRGSWSGMDLEFGQQQQHHAIELDVDFWPLEHPMEPQDEDRPVKCPMSPSSSSSSSINDGKVAAECSRKRSEQPQMVNNGIAMETEPPVRAVRKRHHTLTRDNHITLPSLPPIPQPQTLTVSQMLHQFHKV